MAERVFFKFNDETTYRCDTATVKTYYPQVETDRYYTDEDRKTVYKIVINEKKQLCYYIKSKFEKDLAALDSVFFPKKGRKRDTHK